MAHTDYILGKNEKNMLNLRLISHDYVKVSRSSEHKKIKQPLIMQCNTYTQKLILSHQVILD